MSPPFAPINDQCLADQLAQLSENLLRNEECFLEEQEWQAILSSMAIASPSQPTDRHPIITSLWTHMSPIPRLFRQTTTYIYTSTHPDHALRDELLLRAYDIRQTLLSWGEEFHAFQQQYQSQVFELKLHELLGVALAMQILLQRIIVALQPLDPDAVLLEMETQGTAERLVALQNEAMHAMHPRTTILLAQKVFIARAAIASKDDWSGGMFGVTARGVISREIFGRWCELLGRKLD
jgi:hypothetical protein